MLRHLLKLIWKRKSRNMMLSLEILLAFLVVFAIAAFGLRYWQLYQLPTGHGWRNQWSVAIRPAQDIANDAATYDRLKRALLDLPEVESVAFSKFGTYEMSRVTDEYMLPDGSQKLTIDGLNVSDDYFKTMDMTPASGHWFSQADDGGDVTPVVINRRLADKFFPGKEAVGQLYITQTRGKSTPERFRVAAVVEQFRSHGEFMDPVYFMLPRYVPGVGKEAAYAIMLKLKPGTPRAFEARLNAKLKQVHSDWNYVITPQTDARASMLRIADDPADYPGRDRRLPAGDGGLRPVRRAVAEHHAADSGNRPAPRAGRQRRPYLPADHRRAIATEFGRDADSAGAAGAVAADRRVRRQLELAGVCDSGSAIGQCDLSAILAMFAVSRLARRAPESDASAAL